MNGHGIRHYNFQPVMVIMFDPNIHRYEQGNAALTAIKARANYIRLWLLLLLLLLFRRSTDSSIAQEERLAASHNL